MKEIKRQSYRQDKNAAINWQQLWSIQYSNLSNIDAIWSVWGRGVTILGSKMGRPLDSSYLNSTFEKYTGWRCIDINSKVIMPARDWYSFIAKRELPINLFVRTPEELDYCDEPDRWHDVVGHIPMLLDERYSEFYVKLAQLALKNLKRKNAAIQKGIDFLGSYAIELGLIEENGETKALGATLYSSSGELKRAFTQQNQRRFNGVLDDNNLKEYDRSSFQGNYFVFESWQQIEDYLDKLYNLI